MITRTSVRLFSLTLAGGFFLLSACTSSRSAAPPDPDPEAVNVGYGTQDRDEVTGAITSVDVDAAQQAPVSHVQDLLRGRVAGVQVFTTPDGYLAVRIRGRSSLRGSNEPLYVLDGVPITAGPGGALVGINPHDVETIEVLKDVASTAIYGVRGANGVILITTKRGE